MRSLFGRTRGEEAPATVVRVRMTDRRSYGEATVSVSYRVQPEGQPAFEAVREARVKMKFLPQTGQRLRVRYDPARNQLLEIVTPPGEEEAAPPGAEPTQEIPWNDTGRANWWADGTRRS